MIPPSSTINSNNI